MATFQIVALTTDEAKKRLLRSLASSLASSSGCIGVTHFSAGNQGHDPVDPFNALTPDVSMTAPTDETISPPMPINSVVDDESSELYPLFQLIIPKGIATGVLSSVYLWGTVFNDAAVEAELNAGGFTSIVPPPPPYQALTNLSGVPTYDDLPTSGNNFGDARNVALTDQDYYWNGTVWKVIHERFLFGISNMPRTIKFDSEDAEFRISLQF
jgi:hypothetical protein